MKKETLLTIVVVALLVLNFGTLGVLLFRKPPHPPGGHPHQLDRQIIEKLNLDEGQQQTFNRLKTAHHEQMLASDRAYRQALESYFSLLKNDVVVPGQQDSLQQILSQIQQERARVTFQHFEDLKVLCHTDQRQSFIALLPDLMSVILPQRPPIPHDQTGQ